jgi:hypothetical protein
MGRLARWCALAGALSLSCAGCDRRNQPAGPTSSAAAALDLGPGGPVVDAFARRLTAMRRTAQDVTGVPATCPDAETRARLGSGSGRALSVADAFLARWGDATASPETLPEQFDFLTAPGLRRILLPTQIKTRSQATDAAYGIRELETEYRYLAVVRPTRSEAPKMKDERFSAGRFDAAVVIVDLSTGRALCATSVSVVSSEEVAARKGTAVPEALWRDFLMRVRRGLEEGVGRMSRQLQLELG